MVTVKEVIQVTKKFQVSLFFPPNDSRSSIDLENVELEADNAEEATELLVAFIADSIEVSGGGLTTAEVEVEYSYQGTAAVYLGEEGSGEDLSEYEDEDALRQAIENGDFADEVSEAIGEDIRQQMDWQVENVSVDAS